MFADGFDGVGDDDEDDEVGASGPTNAAPETPNASLKIKCLRQAEKWTGVSPCPKELDPFGPNASATSHSTSLPPVILEHGGGLNHDPAAW
jgi:hypothetical protein